jgi:hypothetical protein
VNDYSLLFRIEKPIPFEPYRSHFLEAIAVEDAGDDDVRDLDVPSRGRLSFLFFGAKLFQHGRSLSIGGIQTVSVLQHRQRGVVITQHVERRTKEHH